VVWLKIRDWRFNKSWILLIFISIVLSLLIPQKYPLLLARVSATNPPTAQLISEGVGAKQMKTGFLSISVAYTTDAIELVRKEQNELQAELDALKQFLKEIKTTAPAEPSLEASPQQSENILSTPQETRLEEIRQAYEETVREVPHYQREYDDTVTESLVEEFGPSIATQLVTGETYTPLVKNQLIKAVWRSRQERKHFFQTLKSEYEALQTAKTTLEKVDAEFEHITVCPSSEQSLDELFQNYNRLIDTQETCETVLKERQQQRVEGHAAVTAPGTNEIDLYPYLYRSLPVTYPVLADTTKVIEQLQRTEERLAKRLGGGF
jgi:DNA repair exonuclease SbcCD ATPase subunit